MDIQVIYDKPCQLGEGPLWHAPSQQLIWFDILQKQMHVCKADGSDHQLWQFEEAFSAAASTNDTDVLLVASETGLWRFSLTDGLREKVIGLEAENSITRSNDGRADRAGNFWIGTMGWNAEKRAGAIYRFSNGTIETVASDITISNAICFSPDGLFGYYVDTDVNQIMRLPLEPESGAIKGHAEVFIDHAGADFGVDGAVVDSEGCIWSARWGDSSVARYRPDGSFEDKITFPAAKITCPAFGGTDLKTLFVTSASDIANPDADDPDAAGNTFAGNVFAVQLDVAGQADVPIKL